jgi:hypothetical protein
MNFIQSLLYQGYFYVNFEFNHLGIPINTKNTHFIKDHPRYIPANIAVNCQIIIIVKYFSSRVYVEFAMW